MLTLYTTPVIYLYMERLARAAAGRGEPPAPARPAPAGSAVNISAPFIRRPIATSLLAAALLLAGAGRLPQLPVAPLPRVDFPTISVSAALPGASPRDDGVGGGDAARAPLRPHRRASPR